MPTILTIEPNENVRHLIREVLQHAGYRVVEAATIPEVTERLVLEEPAVIILDCLLGGAGLGLDLLREIRAMPRTCHIPVVLTTGVPEPNIDARLNHCGASAFLLKPFGPRDLVQAVALALALRPNPATAAAAC
jgi:two-component system, OmpR family, phosphate regulon response regulator PhoB